MSVKRESRILMGRKRSVKTSRLSSKNTTTRTKISKSDMDYLIESALAEDGSSGFSKGSSSIWTRKHQIVLPENRIITPLINEINDSVISHIARFPSEMRNLSSRMFEELIAAILHKHGWDVKLSGRSQDNGIDIVASSFPSDIPLKILVQCKRYAEKRKVGISVIKELYATKIDVGASLAMCVTSSSYTKNALAFANRHNFELDLKNFDDIVRWIVAGQDLGGLESNI